MVLANPEVKRLVHEACRRLAEEWGWLRQRRLETMDGYLIDFLDDLLNYPLVRPWRQSLEMFHEHYWQQIGLRLTPDSYQKLAALIEEAVNDPSCYAYGPIQPDATGLPPGRRLEDVLADAKAAQAASRPRDPTAAIVVTPEPENVSAATAEQRNQLRESARKAALLEQKRIGSTDEELPRYEYFLYDNLLRLARGQTLRTMVEYWTRRNGALDKITLLGENQPTHDAASVSKTSDADSSMVAESSRAAAQKTPSTPAESKPTSGPKWLELRVDAVLFPFGSYKTDSFSADIAEANKIFEGCRIKVTLASTRILDENDTRKAGMIYQPQKGQPTRAILDPDKLAAVAGPKTSRNATVYYVPEIRGGAAGQRISGDSAVVASVGASGKIRQSRVLAHELAHVIGGLPHDNRDIYNLMIDVTESDLKALGLAIAWEQFKKRYKRPTATAIDLQKRFYAFIYDITAASTRVRPDQCKDMRTSPLLHGIE